MTELFSKEPEIKYQRITCECKEDPKRRYAVVLMPSLDPRFFVGECPLCHKRHARKVVDGKAQL